MLLSSESWIVKCSLTFLMAMAAVVGGYFLMYWWTTQGLPSTENLSVLKNQIVAVERAEEVKQELRDLGYGFEDDQFFQLKSPSSTPYHADVLGGYEPVKEEDPAHMKDGYYFYDHRGFAFYFTVDSDNHVDPESLKPLIQE